MFHGGNGRKHIHLSFLPSEGEAKFEVRRNGVGMSFKLKINSSLPLPLSISPSLSFQPGELSNSQFVSLMAAVTSLDHKLAVFRADVQQAVTKAANCVCHEKFKLNRHFYLRKQFKLLDNTRSLAVQGKSERDRKYYKYR